jgi:hypothetical protein
VTVPERPVFGAGEVLEINSKLETDDAAFIIGGQATNFWAWFYQAKEPELRLKGPFTSEDIDYFGGVSVAMNFAAALNGTLYLPDHDDHTPNTAQIVTQLNGKALTIDFLGSVLGIKDPELQKGVTILEVAGELEGVEKTVLVKVLHPLLCLKSRVINILHPATRRTDPIARRQLDAAVVIVRRYIDDALADGDWKEARDCFRTLYWYLRSDEYVKQADLRLDVDLLNIVRSFADDARIDARFRQMQLRPMIINIEKKRANRARGFSSVGI